MSGFPALGADLLVFGGVLSLTLVLGILAHEAAHTIVLRAFDIDYEVELRPDGPVSGTQLAMIRPIVTVTPCPRPPNESSVGLRLAGIAPLTLTAPFLLVLVGLVPDPLAMGNPAIAAATVGWAAVAIPSPQDFSVFWHGSRQPATHHEEK